MRFLSRAIKRGIDKAVGDAVEQGVRKAVEPKIEQATESAVNSATNRINTAAGAPEQPIQTAQPQSTVNQAEVAQTSATLGGLFGGLTSFANEAAKNMKICPFCGEGAGKDVKFCPRCGSKLPEATLGDGAVCLSCGKQNQIGTKFCQDCGTKLPAAIQEEQAAAAKDAEVMAQWDTLLPQYPKWCFGGKNFNIDESDGYIMFAVRIDRGISAQGVVNQYCGLLRQNGFRPAGESPDPCHLYKMVDGICYHCDTEHCFDGDSDCPIFNFTTGEPIGGFDYVKPEAKKSTNFKDLFKF